jgi:hypothetical protein
MKKKVKKAFCGGDWRANSCRASRGEFMSMKMFSVYFLGIIATVALGACALVAQAPATQTPAATYQPKSANDPARSDSEDMALRYMRVVMIAQHKFDKQYGHFATSLTELVHTGNFTKRMVDPHRGDYTASFKGKKDSFMLTMTPEHIDAQHRSFYAEDDGKIHGDEEKPAGPDSPVVK